MVISLLTDARKCLLRASATPIHGAIWAVAGWAIGGVAAFVLVAVKARRGR